MNSLRNKIEITAGALKSAERDCEVWAFFIDQMEGVKPMGDYFMALEYREATRQRLAKELENLQEILRFAEAKEAEELAS
jgi:hypothetical protein